MAGNISGLSLLLSNFLKIHTKDTGSNFFSFDCRCSLLLSFVEQLPLAFRVTVFPTHAIMEQQWADQPFPLIATSKVTKPAASKDAIFVADGSKSL